MQVIDQIYLFFISQLPSNGYLNFIHKRILFTKSFFCYSNTEKLNVTGALNMNNSLYIRRDHVWSILLEEAFWTTRLCSITLSQVI